MDNRHSSTVDPSPGYGLFGGPTSSWSQPPEQHSPPIPTTHLNESRPQTGLDTLTHELDIITDLDDLRDFPASPIETCMSRASLGTIPPSVISSEPCNSVPPYGTSGGDESSNDDTNVYLASQGFLPDSTKTDVYNSPSSLKDRGGRLTRLPLELLWLIADYVRDTSDGLVDPEATRTPHVRTARRELSRISLVCYKWSDIIRPKLFQDLELTSPGHIYFVLSMLRRQGNEWLATAITTLHLGTVNSHSDIRIGLERILRLLSGKLLSLQRLRYFSSPGVTDSLGPSSLPILQRYSSLHELELTGIKVLTFSSLAHLLGMLPMLQVLKCREVRWSNQDTIERRPARIAPFLHLREVYFTRDLIGGEAAPCALLWLHPVIRTISDHDVVIVQRLIKQVYSMHGGNTTTAFTYVGETDKLVVEHSNRSKCTITFLPPSDAPSNTINSAVWHIDIHVNASLHIVTSSEADWKALDTAFAREVVILECLAFHIDYNGGHGLPSVEVRTWFPELHELNRLQVHELNRPQAHELNRPQAHELNRPQAHELNRPQAHELNRPQAHEQYDHNRVPRGVLAATSSHPSKIYANEMYSFNEGHGLWFPEPDETGIPRIGDVGYFTLDGAFVRLLNVTGHSVEVTGRFPPEIDTAGFSTLTIPPIFVNRRASALAPKAHLSPNVTCCSGDIIRGPLQAGVAVRYRCERKHGAILELDRPADIEWLDSTSFLRNFILRNYKQWAPAEKTLGLPQGSLIFVTGHMRTAGNWLLTVLNGRRSSFEAMVAEGIAGAGGVAISTSVARSWGGPVLQRDSRLLAPPAPNDGMPGQAPTRQSTLFVKGYRVKEIGPYKFLRAAAGPHDIDGDWRPPNNVEGIVVEASEDDEQADTDNSDAQKDPLEHLLDYILEASEATTAVGCHDDLYLLLNNEWPSNLKAYLRELQPKIDVTDEKVGSISMVDAMRRRERRTSQRAMRGMDRGRAHEEETPGTSHDGQIMLGEGPHAGSPIDWPHMVFKHKDAENGSISNAIISPDGKLLAVAWDDVVISLWVLNDGSPGLQLEEAGHSDTVYTLAFSPDSTRLVSGSLDCTAIVWVVGEGVAEWTLSGHGGAIMTVAYAPDGCLVATGSDDSTVKVWGTSNGLLLHTLEGHDSTITRVAFSPSGTRLASCADAVVVLWDPLSGQKIAELTSHATAIYDLAFSQDGGRLITGSEDQSGRVWDATTGKELLVLHQHTDAIFSVNFTPDSMEIITGSHDGTVTSCGSFNGLRHHVFAGQRNSPVETAACSKDGRFITSGYADGYISLWSAKSGASLAEYRGHKGKVRYVEFTPRDDGIMSFADDGTIRIWSIVDIPRLT